VWAWVLTIPCAALTAAVSYWITIAVGADIILPVGIAGAASWLVLFLRQKRRRHMEDPIFAPP
jgi:hypothetical protein